MKNCIFNSAFFTFFKLTISIVKNKEKKCKCRILYWYTVKYFLNFSIVDFTVTLQIHLKDVKCNLTIFIDDFWVFIKLG